MNKITKRIVASLSAAALMVSTFGSNSFSGTMMDSVYAEESATSTSNRKGRSTGFENLEQDTDGEYYNTGYGLHTNKTASVAEGSTDGRTFDVNLESWYVGENPVDIATILDASGSMAWTVDTLEPLEIPNETAETLREIQKDNGGYLPEEKVEELLKPENTDNTKLSYSGYKYYVYEDRSTVSEFVPLGFWDGGKSPLNDENLVGYYPFDKTLENKAPNAAENTNGKVISLPADGNSIDTEKTPTETVTPVFDSKGLDIQQTASEGGVMLDKVPKESKFTIQIDIGKNKAASTNNQDYGETPILYITDGSDEHFLKIYRPGSTSMQRLRVYSGEGEVINANKVFTDDGKALTWTFGFDLENSSLVIGVSTAVDLNNDKTVETTEKTISKTIEGLKDWNLGELQIIVGGATEKIEEEYSEVFVKNLVIKENDTEIANYPLTKDLSNTTTDGSSAFMVEQAYNNGGTFNTTPLEGIEVEAVYGNGGLDINGTTKKGAAVLLGAVPNLSSEKGFTLSFKLQKNNSLKTDKQNLFYLGNKSESDYYQFFRSSSKGGYLVLSKGQTDTLDDSELYYQGGLVSNDKWYTNTLVFEPSGNDRWKVTPYVDGLPAQKDSAGKEGFPNGDTLGGYHVPESIPAFTIDNEELVLLLGALQSNSTNSNHYIDDFYVFNSALSADDVNLYFGVVSCEVDNASHARSVINGEVVDIAQISSAENRLAQNSNIGERRGWYYVNSHANWEDVTGCLESGKQYIGIKEEKSNKPDEEGEKFYNHESIATIPNAWYSIVEGEEKPNPGYEGLYNSIKTGDDKTFKYEPPETERSIRFFVDEAGYLRCFVWTGANTKKDTKDTEPRTFCSVVYCNGDDSGERSSVTKYEQLNAALNTFFEKLAENSDLTNTAVVRFSTNNAIVKKEKDVTTENLKKLIIKDWTNWSDYYQETKNGGRTPSEKDYLQDLLIPAEGETSLGVVDSAVKSGEYPYVMTGGTYTWTGLKSFYDNMIVGNSGDPDLTNYNISIDARDKYLIIFTDGRDNTQDCDWNEDGTPDKDSGSNYKKTDYVNDYKPDKSDISKDGELAKAWADEIKASGYTIFCVMMATGSISPTANKEEYNKAHNFLNTLAGSETENKEALDKAIDEFLTAYNDWKENENNDLPELSKDTWYDAEVDSKGCGDNAYELYIEAKNLQDYMNSHVLTAEPGTTNTTAEAFSSILAQIQQPRTDYTVQDYIDPRFNLIDKNGVLYELGPNGRITYKEGTTEKVVTVGNIIDNPRAEGLPFTTRDAENVNVKSVTTDAGGKRIYVDPDKNGTGYIYYDDVKDMYYLRWTDQIIPMRNSSFDTVTSGADPEYLDVWSATIRLKAKDDFIGGNDILTNGNEAGENLVFSEATIENMDAYPELYNFAEEKRSYTEREKLQVLSGTDRKINAVDAGGVSQAVYGEGIDIPSSGFPRVTVNVRLLKLDAKNLNDVIYMGELVSPTMMLADLENDYMTGSYYLQYLERYAYRLYGSDADQKPLIELLNQWLKINDEKEAEKTFTIPYIYLPDPEYNEAGNLVKKDGKVSIENSTGLDSGVAGGKEAFDDLNLRDVTGFITYTWKRDDSSREEQQKMEDSTPEAPKYDITKEYVVKNTDQIVYNLQLKFTPLKKDSLTGFILDENFIKEDASGNGGEKFFKIENSEFNSTGVTKWTFTNRSEYLKAMVKEEHTFEPHVMYDASAEGGGKWVLVDPDHLEQARDAYIEKNDQTVKNGDKQLEDKGVYDWNSSQSVGNEQIEADKLKEYYTGTPNNVGFADKNGVTITNEDGDFKAGTSKEDVCSLVANTIYTKDVVNGALALELVVDGKYLKGSPVIKAGKEYIFTATRYYDDPYDPLPYGTKESKNADTDKAGQQYQLTFVVDKEGHPKSIPADPQEGEFYTVLAYLDTVKVEDSTSSGVYNSIKGLGYADVDALPIGTYKIEVTKDEMEVSDTASQYYIGNSEGTDQYFKYLKVDSTPSSYIYNRFPESVYSVSKTAKKSTNDSEYLIWDDSTDYAPKNIAKNKRINEAGTQTLTFYLGTVEERRINGKPLTNTIGYSGNDKSEEAKGNDYTKDRLGIMLLSADLNNLFISKEVTHTNSETEKYKTRPWKFTVTFTPNDGEESEFTSPASGGLPTFNLTWYQRTGSSAPWNKQEISTLPEDYPNGSGGTGAYPATISFSGPDSDGKYTATIYLRHNEKVLINDLPDGEWQVEEMDERSAGAKILYSAHNDMDDDTDDYSWSNKTLEWASLPGAGVQFTNQFPFYILSAGGSGTYLYILCGSLLLLMASVLYYLSRLRKSKSRDKPDG